MRRKSFYKNYRPFTAVCDCHFGRSVIFTDAEKIDETNVIDELNKALPIHYQNAEEIAYLDRYYRGDQPILYRQKKGNRDDVNNKIVENLAYFIVETKASDMVGEPIQYVLRGTDETKAEMVNNLNTMMDGEDKSCDDIELCRWRSICGTAYRFVGKDDRKSKLLDESSFKLTIENPILTCIAYKDLKTPAFSVQIRKDVNGKDVFNVYTDSEWFLISQNKIVEKGENGNGAIPVVEYPNNERRLSDIEITIAITDEINTMASDRANGIEQFVSNFLKFVNCDVSTEDFLEFKKLGAIKVNSNEGSENKADVDFLSSELNQTESQVAVNDQYEKLLVIQGIANRQGNTGGDTGSAVQYRNGFYSQEKRAEIYEPIFVRSERMMLRLVLNRLRIDGGFTLLPSDVEIKISRNKTDNMLTKAEVMQILLACGIDNARAIKTVGLFSDPEQVASESRERMEILYPKKKEEISTTQQKVNEDGENNEE